ncbi:zinc finger protein 511 isoform X2 [Dermochelys coriacea]|uniref:zinc finger protein 511 isoform X2 n=1 Tax=Dermochelys coriacea TaxID=27794 RepID=UPI001CA936EE|nr:zinc finger protein 511 isoform X2 [Dermochelys coriacea]
MLLPPELSVSLRVERPLLPVWPRTPPRAPFGFSPSRLRFHRQHEFFEDGDIHRHLYLQDILTNVTEVTERSKVSEFCCHIVGCCQVFDTLEGYEHHYNTLHRNMCSFCKRSFPSGHLLDTHILEWHDSLFQIMAEKQNMYQCLVEGCAEKFKSSKDRKDHLVKVHLYPSDFRFDKPKKAKSTKHSKPPSKLDVSMPMDVNVETYEQLQVDSMEICPSESVENPTQPVSGPISSLQEKKLYKSRIGRGLQAPAAGREPSAPQPNPRSQRDLLDASRKPSQVSTAGTPHLAPQQVPLAFRVGGEGLSARCWRLQASLHGSGSSHLGLPYIPIFPDVFRYLKIPPGWQFKN